MKATRDMLAEAPRCLGCDLNTVIPEAEHPKGSADTDPRQMVCASCGYRWQSGDCLAIASAWYSYLHHDTKTDREEAARLRRENNHLAYQLDRAKLDRNEAERRLHAAEEETARRLG